MTDTQHLYRPGIRGWWAFFWRYSPIGADKRDWLRDLSRRWRPSARLRQSEIERAYYQRIATTKESA